MLGSVVIRAGGGRPAGRFGRWIKGAWRRGDCGGFGFGRRRRRGGREAYGGAMPVWAGKLEGFGESFSADGHRGDRRGCGGGEDLAEEFFGFLCGIGEEDEGLFVGWADEGAEGNFGDGLEGAGALMM